MRRLRAVLIGLLILLPSQLLAGADPLALRPYRAEYSARFDVGISLEGRATITLAPAQDGRWRFSLKASTTGASISESSLVEEHDSRLRSVAYRYERKVLGKRKRRSLDFDWASTSYRLNGKQKARPLPQGRQIVYDKLGYQLQLWREAFSGRDEISFPVLDNGTLKTHHYRLVGERTLDTPLGPLETLLVERVREPGSKRRTRIWYSVAPPYLIVRLEQREVDGKEYIIGLERFEAPPRTQE